MLAIFYPNDGLVQAWYSEMLQSSLAILIKLFKRVGLRTNTSKSESMVYILGWIKTRLTDDVYNNSHEGLFYQDEWYNRRVEYDICKKYPVSGSLTSHLETQHDVYRSFVLNRDLIVDREPWVLNTTYSHATKLFFCPFPGCTEMRTKWNLG